MKKILSIILLVAVVIAMIATCPDEKQHRETMEPIIARVASQIAQEKASSIGLGRILNGIGLGNEEKVKNGYDRIGKTMAPALVKMIKVQDCFLFSIGRMNYEGTTYPVSFGIFGHVFALPLDKIEAKMTEMGID